MRKLGGSSKEAVEPQGTLLAAPTANVKKVSGVGRSLLIAHKCQNVTTIWNASANLLLPRQSLKAYLLQLSGSNSGASLGVLMVL